MREFFRWLRMSVKILITLIVVITIVPAAMAGVGLGIVLFTGVPVRIPEPKARPPVQPSHVYDIYGNEIAVFKEFESNIPIRDEDIPLVLKHAVIAAEDRSFYAHSGVDPRGLIRAVVRDVQNRAAVQGGSTITQQYVKNVYANNDAVDAATEANSDIDPDPAADPAGESTPDGAPGVPGALAGRTSRAPVDGFFGKRRTLNRKLREAIIANRLDRTLSKSQILLGYMQNIYLGEGAYGMGAAAQTYFRKPVRDLTLSEAATLAGLIPAPSVYEPRHNPSAAEVKRIAVLRAMREVGYITAAEERREQGKPIWSLLRGAPPVGKPVTLVYPTVKIETRYPYFVDYVRRYLVARFGEERLKRDGLLIQTTLDPLLQQQAEESVAATLKGTKAPLEMSLAAVEPLTGYVKALVGGRDFNAADGQVNLALGDCPTVAELSERLGHAPKLAPLCRGETAGGGSGRSPGSSIKPIVLAAALAEGISPKEVYDGSRFKPPGCGRGCRGIGNFEGAAYGPVNLRTATIKSVNTVYARLGIEVGIEKVAKMAQKLGVTSAWYDSKVHGASYAIGGIDVSPLEMAAAFSVFAGRGLRAPATPIVRIIDARGRIVEDNIGNHTVRVLDENVADNLNSILQGVVDEGTGKRAHLPDRPAAGKTGTSQGNGNAWFVGYTPALSAAVWMGYKDRPRPLRGIKGQRTVEGGEFPAITWGRFMRQAMKDVEPSEFTAPAPIRRVPRLSRILQERRKARNFIDPGAKRKLGETETSTFVVPLGAPVAVAPQGRVAPIVVERVVPAPVPPGSPSPGSPAVPGQPDPAAGPVDGVPPGGPGPGPVPAGVPGSGSPPGAPSPTVPAPTAPPPPAPTAPPTTVVISPLASGITVVVGSPVGAAAVPGAGGSPPVVPAAAAGTAGAGTAGAGSAGAGTAGAGSAGAGTAAGAGGTGGAPAGAPPPATGAVPTTRGA